MSEDSVVVELDIFSGRPNPSWRVGEPERATLRQLLDRLRPSGERSAPRPGLGYRGLIVRIAAQDGEKVLHIFGHAIERDGQIYRDKDRTVEKFLIKNMPPELRTQFESILPN